MISFFLAVMPNGAFDPAWPILDPQQQQQPSQCYPQFNVSRPKQLPATKGAFQSHLKPTHKLPNSSNNSGTLNRTRPTCAQMTHRPWSPPAVDQFGRHIPMVMKS